MRKVIVLGGAGFIGSNLAEELAKKHHVVIIDDLSTGRIENIQIQMNDNIEFVKGSISDLSRLRQIFEGAYCVFHQAAIPSVQRSIENPLATNEVNVDGTLKVLIAARDCGIKKVVYASSSSVYGTTAELPKKESMKPNPLSAYAASKLAGEYYCTAFSVYGLKTVALRYFNVYGPKQDACSDYAAVIPRFIAKVRSNNPPVIYGDGQNTRDFTFVKDVVRANILAMDRGEGAFNIASGKRISINELADMIAGMLGKNLKAVYTDPRKGDVRHSLADISRAKKELQYEPEYSLEEGLDMTIKWFESINAGGK